MEPATQPTLPRPAYVKPNFAKRPERATNALCKPVKLFSNYYGMKYKSADIKGISKY